MRPFSAVLAKPNQRGFTLLEVLIALLVLTIGLLGLAGMQMVGLRNNQGAYERSVATILAYDIADRIRANKQGEQVGKYKSSQYTEPGTQPSPNCITSDCDTPHKMANYDLSEWRINLDRALPGGRGKVEEDDGQYEITVRWSLREGGATEAVVFFEP